MRYSSGFHNGFDFIFGKRKYFKTLLGFNYNFLQSAYNYVLIQYYNGVSNYTMANEDRYNKTHYLSINTGFRIRLTKRFYMEPLLSVSCVLQRKTTANGSLYSYNSSIGNPFLETTTYYREERIEKYRMEALSAYLRLGYDFKIKNNLFGVFAAFNGGISERLLYLIIGMNYYPFKKLQ